MKSVGQLELTEDEFMYLKDSISKFIANRDKLSSNIFEGMKASLELLKRDIIDNELRSIKMRRHEKRFLQSLLGHSIYMLEKKIIPGYVQRSITPNQKQKYAPYIEKAKAKRDLLIPLLEKIEVGL